MVSKATSKKRKTKRISLLVLAVKILFLNIFNNTRALSLFSPPLSSSSSSSRLEQKTRARRRRRRRLLSHVVFYGIYFTSFYSWVVTVPPKSGTLALFLGAFYAEADKKPSVYLVHRSFNLASVASEMTPSERMVSKREESTCFIKPASNAAMSLTATLSK